VALTADDQLPENPMVEQQFAPLAPRPNVFDKDKIRSARTNTLRFGGGQNKKFTRFEMRGALKANLGHVRDRVTPAARHLFNLLQDQIVVITGCHTLQSQTGKCSREQ